jgi:hypothetical protein
MVQPTNDGPQDHDMEGFIEHTTFLVSEVDYVRYDAPTFIY